jgi:hypothetical protein
MPRKPINGRAMTAAERQRRYREIAVQEPPMTRLEREDLQRLARYREKILKSAARQRSAELMADFEQQAAPIYDYDKDEVWKAATAFATEAAEEARQRVAARAAELGIPEHFRPTLNVYWLSRGRDGVKERRDELRKVAKARVAALEAEAIVKIELHTAETVTRIIAHGLTSTAAREFLDSLPAVETLMPPLDVAAVRNMLESRGAQQRYYAPLTSGSLLSPFSLFLSTDLVAPSRAITKFIISFIFPVRR